MTSSTQSPFAEPNTGRRRRFQFGLWVWFPVVLMVSVVLGALSGMLRADDSGGPLPKTFFILMAAAAPVGLLLLMSLLRWVSRRGRKK
jgi:hypothetical protein